MTTPSRDRNRRLRMRVLVATTAAAFACLMVPADSQAQPKIVKGIGNVGDAIGDGAKGLVKGLDINPGVVKNNPMGVLPQPPKPKPSAPFGQLPPRQPSPNFGKLPPNPGIAPTPPPRPLPALPAATGPNRPLPDLPVDPPVKYSGLGPDNAPVRNPRPEKSTGLDGLIGHEPNPQGVPIPVKVNPNAPVKLPSTPVASNTPKVNLPQAPMRFNPPPLGAPPPALLRLYGEDVATQQLRQMKRASQIKKVATGVALAGTGTLVVLAAGGIYLGVTCTAEDLSLCPEFARPTEGQ